MSKFYKGRAVNFLHKKKSGNGYVSSTKKGKVESVEENHVSIRFEKRLYRVNKEAVTLIGEQTKLNKDMSAIK